MGGQEELPVRVLTLLAGGGLARAGEGQQAAAEHVEVEGRCVQSGDEGRRAWLAVQCEGGDLLGKCAVFNVQCSMCSVQCAVCSVQCAVCSVQFAVCSVQCAMFTAQCAVFSAQFAVCSVQCAVYKAVGTLCGAGFASPVNNKSDKLLLSGRQSGPFKP